MFGALTTVCVVRKVFRTADAAKFGVNQGQDRGIRTHDAQRRN